MVKKIFSSLVVSNATSSKALDKILALKAEVSRLRHHVSILLKRLHKLDPSWWKHSRADSSPFLIIEEDILWSVSGGKAVENEEGAEQSPQVADELEGGTVTVAVAEHMAMATFETGAVAVEFCGKRRRLEDEMGLEEEDVLVGGKIVPLGGLEPSRAEVVKVGSLTVVPSAPRTIQEMREREVVHGAPAGPRARGGTGVGMGPSRGRGYGGFGGSAPSGVAFRGGTRGFYARGRGRGS